MMNKRHCHRSGPITDNIGEIMEDMLPRSQKNRDSLLGRPKNPILPEFNGLTFRAYDFQHSKKDPLHKRPCLLVVYKRKKIIALCEGWKDTDKFSGWIVLLEGHKATHTIDIIRNPRHSLQRYKVKLSEEAVRVQTGRAQDTIRRLLDPKDAKLSRSYWRAREYALLFGFMPPVCELYENAR